MSYFEFPHTRNYDGDLGYLIKAVNDINDRLNSYLDYNSIRISDPIQWDISTQYPAFMIVCDYNTNKSFISKKEVPAGIVLTNSDYWEFVGLFSIDSELNTDSYNPIANKPVALAIKNILTALGVDSEKISEIETSLTSINSSINSLTSNLNNETNSRIEADSVLDARIDEIVGGASVDPDTELIDIRVGANGTTYASAGTAVRSQVEILENKLKVPNSLAGLKWFNGYYQSSDMQFVSTPYWKMSNVIPVTAGDTFIYHGISEQTNRCVILYYNKSERTFAHAEDLGTNYTDITVTVPDGAYYMRVLAKDGETDKVYIDYGSNAFKNPLYRLASYSINNENEINNIKLNNPVYIDGSQETDGTGAINNPFNSIMSAINAGYTNLKIKKGIYTIEHIEIPNKPLNMSLWSNIASYNTSVPDREKIVLFKGDKLTPTTESGLLTAPYTPISGRRFERVFVDRTLPCIDPSFTLAVAYNVCLTLWKPGHRARRYEPVLTEDFTEEPGTFTYRDNAVVIAPFDSDGVSGLEIYISDDPAIPITITNAPECNISDLAIIGGYFQGIKVVGSQNVKVNDCEFIATSHGDGIEVFDSNIVIDNCLASGNCQDGYGFQVYGTSILNNCDAFYSGDDGISHHNGTIGYINGGEYSYNTSGGITPAFGADINISNTKTFYNENGLQFFGAGGRPHRNIIVSGCVSKNNNNKDIYNTGYDIDFINCVYDTESATSENHNTFYG